MVFLNVLYSSGIEPGVYVPRGTRRGYAKASYGICEIEKKILFCDKYFISDVDYGLCATTIMYQ
jgi:hypothetical protein